MHSLVYLVLLTLCACASPKAWHHESKGQQDFYRDNSECMAMAGSGQGTTIPGGGPFMSGYNQGAAMQAAANQRTIHRQCMFGRGWALE